MRNLKTRLNFLQGNLKWPQEVTRQTDGYFFLLKTGHIYGLAWGEFLIWSRFLQTLIRKSLSNPLLPDLVFFFPPTSMTDINWRSFCSPTHFNLGSPNTFSMAVPQPLQPCPCTRIGASRGLSNPCTATPEWQESYEFGEERDEGERREEANHKTLFNGGSGLKARSDWMSRCVCVRACVRASAPGCWRACVRLKMGRYRSSERVGFEVTVDFEQLLASLWNAGAHTHTHTHAHTHARTHLHLTWWDRGFKGGGLSLQSPWVLQTLCT